MKTAFCLFEFSDTFGSILRENGYQVVSIDKRLGSDILNWDFRAYSNVKIIISHPPCTHFSRSGARHWKEKDEKQPELLEYSIKLVKKVLEIVNFHSPNCWFVENPIGRIGRCVPELNQFKKFYFDPYQYAGWANNPNMERYTKRTVLFGKFIVPSKKPIVPIAATRGHHSMDQCLIENGISLGGFHERAKWRSLTPSGFAQAFCQANMGVEIPNQQQLYLPFKL